MSVRLAPGCSPEAVIDIIGVIGGHIRDAQPKHVGAGGKQGGRKICIGGSNVRGPASYEPVNADVSVFGIKRKLSETGIKLAACMVVLQLYSLRPL